MSIKEKLRIKAAALRKDAHKNDDGMAARLIAAQVIMLPELDKYKNVAGYYTIRDELDALVIMKALHAARFKLSLPKIIGKDMPLEFRSWDMGLELVNGPFGTKEPIGDLEIPEVILAPLLAFDKDGTRLGYGGGYYDRTIKQLRKSNPELCVIGLAYENQKLDAIPYESYDQPLDMVVTEKTTYRFK